MNDRDGPADSSRVLSGFDVLPPMNPAPKRQTAKETPVPAGRRAARNRFAVVNAFLDVSARTLPPSASLVWVLLWRDTKPEELARTAQEDLARRSGLTPKTVKRAIRILRAGGLLEVVQRGRLGAGPSVYRLFPLAGSAPTKGTK